MSFIILSIERSKKRFRIRHLEASQASSGIQNNALSAIHLRNYADDLIRAFIVHSLAYSYFMSACDLPEMAKLISLTW